MDLHLPSMASSCFVSGNPFVEDERVVSRLLRRDEDGEVVRVDVQAPAEEKLELPAGRVACRWVQVFKPKVAEENPDKELKLTAENLFLTLADPGNELSEEDARLVQFLALMLERKKLIRPQGRSEEGDKEVYIHRGTKNRYEVPVGELTPEFFLAVQDQLSVLVGVPESDDAPAETAAEASDAAPEQPKEDG
jgi:hypothetical protein